MMRSLHSKSLFYFIILSLLSIFLMSSAFKLSFDECFAIYLDNSRKDEIEKFTKMVSDIYIHEGKIDKKSLADNSTLQTLLSYQGMSESLFYEVYSSKGNKILDSTQLISKLMNTTNTGTANKVSLNDIGFISETHPLLINNEKIGTITTYYKLGYKKGEFQFKQRLNKHIFIVEIMMVLIALLLSFVFSNKLTYSLKKVSEIAKQLRSNLSVRIPVKNLSIEIEQVALSINDLAESLSHQEMLRKQFFNDMAHEIRTPISALRNQIEAFQDGIWAPTPEKLDKCHSELMRLVRLVNEQEQLMVVENPKLQLNLEPISLREELANIIEAYLPVFQKKNISLKLKEIPDNDWLLADRDHFTQIISNLLMNCHKYTNQNGKVTIRAFEKDDYIQIRIEDDGIGISKEDLPFIFERFYRGDKSRDRKTGGFGIGLSIVKALVLAHGGTIEVESELNIGTKIILGFRRYTGDINITK